MFLVCSRPPICGRPDPTDTPAQVASPPTNSHLPRMHRDQRTESMMRMARELARHGHRLQMIETLLEANGFYDAYALLDQSHVHNELLQLAAGARRGEDEKVTGSRLGAC
jgi:hypothetical protein